MHALQMNHIQLEWLDPVGGWSFSFEPRTPCHSLERMLQAGVKPAPTRFGRQHRLLPYTDGVGAGFNPARMETWTP